MSLIVAHVDGNGVFDVVSDLRTTWTHAPPAEWYKVVHPRLDHALLKIMTTEDQQAFIAYAGTVPDDLPSHLAAFRQIDGSDCAGLAAAAAALSSRSDPAGGRLEVVLGELSSARLTRCRDGASETITQGQFAWIGDDNAFSRFQEEYERRKSVGPRKAMELAMTEVIDSGAFATVGGFTVAVDTRHVTLGFALQPVSFLALGGTQLTTVGPGAAQLTSPTNGQYLAQAIVAEPPDSAIGYWFPQSSNGFVSAPVLRLEPFTIDACSLADFISESVRQTGLRFAAGDRTRGSAIVL